MPSRVYSTTFVAKKGLTDLWPVTIPAGYTALVTGLDAYIGATALPEVLYLHGTDGQAIWFATSDPEAGPGYFSWRGRFVVEELEVFDVQPASGTWDVTVSGYLLVAT